MATARRVSLSGQRFKQLLSSLSNKTLDTPNGNQNNRLKLLGAAAFYRTLLFSRIDDLILSDLTFITQSVYLFATASVRAADDYYRMKR